jgi:mono/diheme cytochrome c family protein
MKKLLIGATACGCLLLAASAFAQMGMMQGGYGMMNGPMARHQFAMRNGVDAKYATMANPLKASDKGGVAAGQKLYGANCASCHGPSGAGDGAAAKGLNPPPANLVAVGRMPIASDGFFYWTIAEGGVQFGSAMPPFKGVLKADEIWKIVLYLRTL